MPDVLHRTTLELRRSAKLHLHPPAEWIHEPDLSAVQGQPVKYWKLNGDQVLLQTAPEQAATDANLAAAAKAEARAAAEFPLAQDDIADGIRWRAEIEARNKRDNYLVQRIAELQAALDAIKASSGPADNIRAAIPSGWLPTSTRPRAAAMSDFRADIQSGNLDRGE